MTTTYVNPTTQDTIDAGYSGELTVTTALSREGQAMIFVDGDECSLNVRLSLRLDDARRLANVLATRVDRATPADPGSIAVLRTTADAIGVTIEVPEQATQDDVRKLSLWPGEQIAERRP